MVDDQRLTMAINQQPIIIISHLMAHKELENFVVISTAIVKRTLEIGGVNCHNNIVYVNCDAGRMFDLVQSLILVAKLVG